MLRDLGQAPQRTHGRRSDRRATGRREVLARNLLKVAPWHLGHMAAMRFIAAADADVPTAGVTYSVLSLGLRCAVAGPATAPAARRARRRRENRRGAPGYAPLTQPVLAEQEPLASLDLDGGRRVTDTVAGVLNLPGSIRRWSVLVTPRATGAPHAG